MTMVNTLPPNDGKSYVWSNDEQRWIEESKEKDPLKEKWFRVAQISKCFGTPLKDIKRAINKGNIQYKKIPGNSRYGTVIYISESAYKEWKNDPNKQRIDISKPVKVSVPDSLDPNEKWLTIREVAAEIRRSESTVYSAIENGTLKSERAGGTIYVSETSVIEYLENKKNKKAVKTEKNNKPVKKSAVNISGWDDISVAIQEFIQKQVEAAVNEKLEADKKAEYQKGFEDGKLSNTHDSEDSYRKGVEDGKKQAKQDLLALIKEVG